MFAEQQRPAIFDESRTPSFEEPPRKMVELLMLGVTILILIVSFLSGLLHVPSLWLLGYLLAVFGGVTSLAVYRQRLVARFAAIHIYESRSSAIFQGVLAVGLAGVAILNAVHLAVQWSS